MPTCSAYGCTSSTRHKGNRDRGIFFHEFPKREKSPERFRRWVEYCNRKDFDPGNQQKSACLCSRHFHVSDMDQSQLLKIKMMPRANLRGPRLKPGTVPSINIEPKYHRKTSKVPHVLCKRNNDDRVDDSTNIVLSSSLMNLKGSLQRKDAFIESSNKIVQCEIGLEIYRYLSGPNCDRKCENLDLDRSENVNTDRFREEDAESSDCTIGESDNENDNNAANGKESSFAAWGNLLLLFRICNVCSKEVTNVRHGMRRNKIFVKSICSCGNKVTWTSQPK